MMPARRQPDKPAAASNKLCSIRTLNGVYTEFGIDPVLGVLVFSRPELVLTGMAYAYGIAAIVMGVADIILYIRLERYTGFGPIVSLVSGILSVMSGIMLIAYPGTGALIMTILLPIWFIAHCISRLANLNRVRFVAGRGMYCFSLIVNILGLILGFMMLLSPLFALSTIRAFAGVYLILLGVDAIVFAVSRMGTRY